MVKLVDKFVKEGKYEDALQLLGQAREKQPSNAYLLAYEERVLALLHEKRRQIIQGPVTQADGMLTPVMDQLNGVASGQAPQKVIDNYLSVARELRKLGEFDNALDQLSQAFLLGPPSPELVQLEEQLWRDREIALKRSAERNKRTQGETIEPESVVQPTGVHPAADRMQPLEHDRQILTRLQRAHRLLESGELDKALEEVAHARTVDPEDKQVHDMEVLLRSKQEKLRLVAERNRRMEEEAKLQARRREQEMKALKQARSFTPGPPVVTTREEGITPAGDYATRARELMKAKRYDDASVEIALGLIVDARHEELIGMKEEILSLSKKQEETTASKPAGRKSRKRVSDHMKAAHASLAKSDFEGALTSITAAYDIDPDNKEVRKLEMVVRREELLFQQEGLNSNPGTGNRQ